MSPFWAAALRFGLAALIFWGVVIFRKLKLPKGRALTGALIFGLLTVGLAFVLIAWGLVATPASLYQILMATVPLLTLFLSAFHGVESITPRGLIGSLLAIAGIIVAVGGSSSATISWPHIAGILVAAAFMAEGGVLLKKFPPNPPMITNAVGMTVGALVLGTASVIAGEAWTLPTRTDTWVAFLYLVLIVTLIAFMQ